MDELNNINPTSDHKVIPFPVHTSNLLVEKYKKSAKSIEDLNAKFSGPLSGAMWKKIQSLNSSYPDTFDWSVYDKLHERFGANQPRGGVVFKTSLKLLNYHTSCSKCHYSLEVDTYGRGCVHNCKFCYAKDQLMLKGYWNRPFPMPMDLSEIRKIFYTVFESDKKSKWRTVLENKTPIRIGSMSDSFMWLDQKQRVTHEFLKILKYYRYPNVIFTRSDLVAHEDYLEVMDPDLSAIQFSISGDNEALTKAIEPGAPSVARRLEALARLKKAGFWTTVRINPLFPTYPDGYFTDKASIKERFSGNIPKLSLLDIDSPDAFLDALKDAGVPTVLAGFVRLNQTSTSQMGKAADVDLKKFFKPEHYKPQGESHYSDSEIAYYYKILQSKCAQRGLRFSTCYIGNGVKDYHQYQKLWSNKSDCCDAKGNVKGITETAQNIPWEERMKHAPLAMRNNIVRQQEESYEKKMLTEAKNPGLVTYINEIKGNYRSLAWLKKQNIESSPE